MAVCLMVRETVGQHRVTSGLVTAGIVLIILYSMFGILFIGIGHAQANRVLWLLVVQARIALSINVVGERGCLHSPNGFCILELLLLFRSIHCPLEDHSTTFAVCLERQTLLLLSL